MPAQFNLLRKHGRNCVVIPSFHYSTNLSSIPSSIACGGGSAFPTSGALLAKEVDEGGSITPTLQRRFRVTQSRDASSKLPHSTAPSFHFSLISVSGLPCPNLAQSQSQ